MHQANGFYSRFLILVKGFCLIPLAFNLVACASSKENNAHLKENHQTSIAFPGAEGFGKYTIGGRGGKVLIVQNTNDNGPGSFREAAEANFPRIIVFAVSGTIHLQKKVVIKSNATIAGQSAPGDGICFADMSVNIGGDNVVVRYLRFRLGDKFQKGGMVDGNGGDDAFGGTKRKNIIIDHCSFSWSTDEAFSIYAGDSMSVQWNLVAEPLNYSYHFEKGDSDYEHHGYGAIWGGMHASFHHNLFAHCNSRTPRFNGIRHTKEENCDYTNNVIYNWGSNNVYAGEGGNYNIINNYYKPGPSTKKNTLNQLVNPFRRNDIPFGKWYVNGNIMEGNQSLSKDNSLGIKLNEPLPDDKIENVCIKNPFSFMTTNIQSAKKAYELVLADVGCKYPTRDTLDQRILNDVKNGTGRFIDVQGGFPHGTAFELTENAWPKLHSGSVSIDTDLDGMPDEWEKQKGLNPLENDASLFQLGKHYTNVEVYLNQLVK
jgi:pectate lyase